MKKRNVRIIALMLAAVIAAGSPMPVRAADFEIEEEVILGGTGGESTALYEKVGGDSFSGDSGSFRK